MRLATTVELYLQFGLIWAGFCMGCQVCKNSGASAWKLGACASVNFALWPISVCLALYEPNRR